MFSKGILLFLLTELVSGSGKFSMRFAAFTNPGGKGNNGNCCDGFSIFCHSPCDHQFTVCLDVVNGSPDLSKCRYGRVVTGEIRDHDSITFGSSIGGTRNPMVFSMNVLPKHLRIKIGIWDVDTNNAYDFVDYMAGNVALTPGRSEASTPPSRANIRKRVTLTVDIKSYCDPGYHGSDCSVFCEDDSLGHYTCNPSTGAKMCRPGWHGVNCDTSVDDCASQPCLNNGLCMDRHRGYVCACGDGYEGFHCETRVDPCLIEPCYNGGMCTDTGTNYTCACPEGWTGSRCTKDVDQCLNSPCFNSGTCVDYLGDFECLCFDGFTGRTCDVDMDECWSNPCHNDGLCKDLANGFQCDCSLGYTGAICDHVVDHCNSDPCANGGTCTNFVGGYQCACVDGYIGLTCETEIDQCEVQPCLNNATCVNLRTNFTCTCPDGFTGFTCAMEIDECSSSPCLNNATCMDEISNVTCGCLEGYTGHFCETDIDDCASGPCENNGTCNDHTGYFTCSCEEVYTGLLCETAITTTMVMEPSSTSTPSFTTTSEAETKSTSSRTTAVSMTSSSESTETESWSTEGSIPYTSTPSSILNVTDDSTSMYDNVTDDVTLLDPNMTSAETTPSYALCFPLYFKGKVDPKEKKNLDAMVANILRVHGDISSQVTVKSHFEYFRDEDGGAVTEVSVNVTVGGKMLKKNELAVICQSIPIENFLDSFQYKMYFGSLYPLSSSSTQSVQDGSKTTIAMIIATVCVAAAVIALIIFIFYRRARERKSLTPELVSIDEHSSQFDNELYMQPNLVGYINRGLRP